MSGFDEPIKAATGDQVRMGTFKDKLIIITPLEFLPKFATKHGEKEVIFADIAVLMPYDGEPYKIFRRVLIGGGYLIGDLKESIGRRLLGTIELRPTTKGNDSIHFKSLTSSQKALKMAEEWWALHEEEFLTQPAATFDDVTPSADTQRTASITDDPWGDEPPF